MDLFRWSNDFASYKKNNNFDTRRDKFYFIQTEKKLKKTLSKHIKNRCPYMIACDHPWSESSVVWELYAYTNNEYISKVEIFYTCFFLLLKSMFTICSGAQSMVSKIDTDNVWIEQWTTIKIVADLLPTRNEWQFGICHVGCPIAFRIDFQNPTFIYQIWSHPNVVLQCHAHRLSNQRVSHQGRLPIIMYRCLSHLSIQ